MQQSDYRVDLYTHEKKKRRPEQRRLSWWALLGALSVLAVLLAAAIGLRLHLFHLRDLDQAVAAWEAQAPSHYRYEVGGSLFEGERLYRITVAEGVIVAGERYSFHDQVYIPVDTGEVAPYTLANLHGWARSETQKQGDFAISFGYEPIPEASYDPVWRFVRSFTMDTCGPGLIHTLSESVSYCQRGYFIRGFEAGRFQTG